MFTSIATYIIRNQKLHEEIEVYHKIGKLELLGIDLHQFSNHPFLKDHDFNVIRDIKTDQTIGVDASVNEYMGFQTVHLGKQL